MAESGPIEDLTIEIIADDVDGMEAAVDKANKHYLWIDKISGDHETIYVPTEAGLPILESRNRLNPKPTSS